MIVADGLLFRVDNFIIIVILLKNVIMRHLFNNNYSCYILFSYVFCLFLDMCIGYQGFEFVKLELINRVFVFLFMNKKEYHEIFLYVKYLTGSTKKSVELNVIGTLSVISLSLRFMYAPRFRCSILSGKHFA